MRVASCEVFQAHTELDRLSVQNRLLAAYEEPIYRRVLAGRRDVRLLDVGSNDGSKTVARFSHGNVSRVIGLEYHHELVERARTDYGDGRFCFRQCDVEAPGFAVRLAELMAEQGVEAFDVIHISLVLLHLHDPGALLALLRGVLAPGGQLIVVEADDSASKAVPDDGHLFRDFLRILSFDPLSGDRHCGGKTLRLLAKSGYRDIALENTAVRAGGAEAGTKADIFDIFCSYLPQDIRLLREREPENAAYAACGAWLDRHYGDLRRMILRDGTEISMGVSIMTCYGE